MLIPIKDVDEQYVQINPAQVGIMNIKQAKGFRGKSIFTNYIAVVQGIELHLSEQGYERLKRAVEAIQP